MTIDFQKNLKKEQKKIKSAKQKTLTNSLSTNKKKEIESLKKKPLTNSSSTNQKKKLNKKSRRSSKLKNKTKKKGGALFSSPFRRTVSPISIPNVFSNMGTKLMSEPKLILSSVDNYKDRIKEITEFSQLNVLMELEKEIKASSLLSYQEKKTLQQEIRLKTKDYQSLYTLFKIIYDEFRSISFYKKTDVIESKLNDLSNDLSHQWFLYKEAEKFISEQKVDPAFKSTAPNYEKTVVPIFEEIQKQFKKTRDILSTNSNLIKKEILSSSSMKISDKIIRMERLNEIGINDYIKDIKGLEEKKEHDLNKEKAVGEESQRLKDLQEHGTKLQEINEEVRFAEKEYQRIKKLEELKNFLMENNQLFNNMEIRYQKELNKKRLRTDSGARPSVKDILSGVIESPKIILEYLKILTITYDLIIEEIYNSFKFTMEIRIPSQDKLGKDIYENLELEFLIYKKLEFLSDIEKRLVAIQEYINKRKQEYDNEKSVESILQSIVNTANYLYCECKSLLQQSESFPKRISKSISLIAQEKMENLNTRYSVEWRCKLPTEGQTNLDIAIPP